MKMGKNATTCYKCFLQYKSSFVEKKIVCVQNHGLKFLQHKKKQVFFNFQMASSERLHGPRCVPNWLPWTSKTTHCDAVRRIDESGS